ncbi:putative polypeptide N-acetylgalactosaminyltransferase 8 [Liparis tanakae]|uniref:Polypeptide N-acetylgalactosaminyltransferase n=1 Tax=Liparis tanakae TaxID=230148 RepID=A0A4Z2J4F8_9TELE|nr:putative polypeptide N-acetylgalactosaminyltransferase 8 [Liparis tanakae]
MALVFYVGMLAGTREDTTGADKELKALLKIRQLSDTKSNISNLFDKLKAFEQKQDTVEKMPKEDRDGKAAEVKQPPVKKQPEQPAAKIQEQQKDPEEKKPQKLFPDSSLFLKWGEDLSEDDQREAQALFVKYGYNVFLSDRLPIDRPLPDTRDKRCLKKIYPKDLPSVGVVLIYLNEALSVVKRAIRSLIDRTPKNLLKEIILVDDNSSHDDLKEDLDAYVKMIEKQNPNILITRVRHSEQRGLAAARVSGWRAATADVVAILDVHIEVHEMWAEPLLTQIKGDRTVVTSPVFDKVNFDDLTVTEYRPASHAFDWALWCMYEGFSEDYYKLQDGSLPGKSPSVMGILVADRKYLGEIGVLDEGMTVYGGENVELGIRVWTCGGSIEVVPCSKIAHIERAHKPYMLDLSGPMKRNALRVAEIWMDEYKHNINLAWNLPFELKNVAANMCLDQGPVPGHTPIAYGCHYYAPQFTYYRSNGELYIGGIKSHRYNDNRCICDVGKKDTQPGLYFCKEAVKNGMGIHWDFIQTTSSSVCRVPRESSSFIAATDVLPADMLPAELPSERVARLHLQRCRDREAERRGRVFSHSTRTIGVDKEALDLQVKEKEQQEEAAREEQRAHDADVLRHSKAALLLHSREVKERRAMEKATEDHRRLHRQPRCQREFEPEDPPCLAGEDPAGESRRQRQKEQLREWLLQQQRERAAESRQRKLEEHRDDQSNADMRDKAVQLQGIEMEQRKAATIAMKDYNLAMIEEKRCQRGDPTAPGNHPLTAGGAEPSPPVEGGPGGSRPSSERSAPLESLQQICQFHTYQMEEKKRSELEQKRDEEQHDRVRLASSRTALLMERQQARVNQQLRRQMDSSNAALADAHKQQSVASFSRFMHARHIQAHVQEQRLTLVSFIGNRTFREEASTTASSPNSTPAADDEENARRT